ncbi:MAG: pyridoxal phosphate-dependent aminotransferase [Planctomycetaceae bacterium]|nr:pyridoxal phosphate-dependent aminotransferase [Planctomycetaceae bacterium]
MDLPSFPLVNWFAAAEGRFDISLSHTDCEPLSVADVLDKVEQRTLAQLPLGYGTFTGLKELRQGVADQYSTLTSDDVLVFGGASEAIYTFMRTNLKSGDEVVVQSPIFNSLRGIAEGIGCRIVDWETQCDSSFVYDVSHLSSLCNDGTKLIVFNFPHNPSGQMISSDELQRIVDIAGRHDAMIFSDEQFRLLELHTTPRLPAACDLYERAVSVTGVSKTFGLGGLRIGWLATRCREILERAKQYRYYTTEMTNTPCQMLAAAALRRCNDILRRNRGLIQSNLELLTTFCARHEQHLLLHPPQAGTTVLIEQKTDWTGTEFCERLLDDQRVFLVPGASMRMSDRLLRIGLGRSDFADGLERLGRFLNSPSVD